MESLKSWITTICVAIIFITAVEMILPDNSLKKYSKFVLGLILMTVILNPILSIFTHDNLELQGYFDKYEDIISSSSEENKKNKEKNVESTLKNFETNISKSCEKILKDKYPKDNFKVQVKADYDGKNFSVSKVEVGFEKDSYIKPIEKVEIKTNSSVEYSKQPKEYTEKEKKISTYISENLNIEEKQVCVYKLDE